MKIIKNINLTYLYIKDLVIEYYNKCNNYIYYYIFFGCCYLFLIYISTIFSILNNYTLYFCYWFGLGLLSTIGFGFGFHTGLFFLFPYVINIKNLAINNNTTDFDLIGNNKFEITSYGNSTPSIFDIFLKVLPTVIIWGIGSCFGEIPPYYLAKISKNNIFSSNNRLVKSYYNNIFYYINKYSFIIILILACWPNITFDMCGMAAGYGCLNIYQFIIITCIGKTLIKASIETYIILFLYDISIFKKHKSGNLDIIFNIIFFITLLYFIYNIINELAKKQLKKIKS